jgi:hypothetical protein
MIRTLRFVCALGLTAGVCLPACGSSKSSDGGSSTFSSGVSKNQSLGTISAGDLKSLCDAFASYGTSNASSQKSSVCKFNGFTAALVQSLGTAKTDADLRKACADAVTSCESKPASADAGTSTCTKPASTCTATVGELETCVNDSSSSLDKAVAGVPACSTLTAKDLQPSDAGPLSTFRQPASCLTLNQKCPGGLSATGG